MGAYLTSPVTDKISSDQSCAAFTYGASSMQGWRISQEDAHNCIPDFDQKTVTSMFAVYDGHGGAEVAKYCSRYLPDCIKGTDQYKEGELGPALSEAFLKFDSTLVEEEVIKELKQMAGVDENDEEDDDDDPVGRAEADDLRAEADLPLEVLLAKYKTPPGGAAVRNLRKKDNVQSPVIRTKKNGSDAEAGPSSSSDVAGSLSSNSNISRAPLINGLADNENNLNKEKELLNSAKSAPSSSPKDGGDDDLKAETSGNDSSSNHTSEGLVCGAGDSGKSVVGAADSSSGCEEGKGCGGGSEKKGDDEGCEVGSSSNSASSGQQASESSAPSSDGVSSSSSSLIEDEGPSASGSGSSKAGGSSSSSSNNGSGSASSGIGSSGSGSSSVGGSKSKKDGEQEVDDNDGSDEEEEDDEDAWQDIESGEEEEDEEDDEGMEESDEPLMDMSNEEPGSDSGCTACVVLLRQDQLVVANAGDSRCVLCRGGTAVDLSNDHKPEDDPERERIEKAGGRVTADGRVNGGLNLSRAIGDHFYKRKEDLPAEKQMITALPDIQTVAVDSMDQFFVVACDGIWNSMSSQECVDFIKERLKDPDKKAKPSLICEELFDHCLADNTFGDGTGCDNMTCIIVVLHPQGPQTGEENGLVPSKRCVREFDSTEENSEKRPRVEEGEGGKAEEGEGEKEAMATSSE